ncbi:MAG: hemolysin A [Acidobacteria bacterium OLB17]|nr:MAG: hemolysin A [Acidobacteria bacterium OLB17]MCZ2391105.1 TlyA family RNA methyltransferase [Acidobacteriota bacterium]
MTAKERIDILLTERGLADSRTKAQALVMAGVVLVNERRIEKPSEKVASDAAIRLKDSAAMKYVGRGGFKLEAALDHFNIEPEGLNCLDIGSSTGGFTDCLLQRGAASVIAVDSGTNQLDWRIRTDSRVTAFENTNARGLTLEAIGGRAVDLIVMDVSFISARMILPVFPHLLAAEGKAIVLIKPQFEVGRGEVGKGGIVREAEKHERVVEEVNACAVGLGLRTVGVIPSPILGAEGNREFLACYQSR